MRFKFYLSFVLFVLVQQCLFAQSEQYKFSHLDITNGLSDNQVNSIFKDDKGFMWFGTTSGISRYDGYRFRTFRHDAKDPHSLGENNVLTINQGPENTLWIFTHSGISIYNSTTEKFSTKIDSQLSRYKISTNQVKAIKKDSDGNFWFLANNKGLYCYHPKRNTTVFYSNSSKSKIALHTNGVMDIAEGRQNRFWLVYNDGVIDQLDLATNKIVSSYDGIAKANDNKQRIYGMTMDSKSNLWVYANGGPIGVYCYNTSNKTLMHFNKDSQIDKLNSNIVNNVVEADDNKIWIGTDHGGIDIVDPLTYKVTYVVNKEDDPKSLSGNSVALYKDNAGIIWAGTFKQGLDYYHSGIMQFPLYKHFITDKNSLPFEDVDCFIEDQSGNLWIGTNGGGL